MDKKDHIPVVVCACWYKKIIHIEYDILRYVMFVFACILLSGCIDEFTPKGAKEVSGILVVDGIITNGESTFTLQRSVKMSDKLPKDAETVDNASLHIECSDGAIWPGQFTENGKYIVRTGDLYPDKEYRLNFTIGEEVYQSSYLAPVMTTAVDSISYKKEKAGAPVSIHVSTHDLADQSPYYRWTYTETWEVKADIVANIGYIDDVWVDLDVTLRSSRNIYYCWGRQESYALLLESTEKLSANLVHQKKLIEIPCDHDKFSILYHVSVKQTQIRKEAYEYFAVLQNTVEQTGGLFSPVLSAGMGGNIRCLTDPTVQVIGYIEASTTAIKERFIDDRSLYEPAPIICPIITKENEYEMWRYTRLGYTFTFVTTETKTITQCADCRKRAGNPTKNKPEWWPSEHL